MLLVPSKTQAVKLMIGLLSIVTIFHALVILKIIPYTLVWAGKLKTVQEMYSFEIISISINVFLLWIILQKANYAKRIISDRILNVILWIFVILFAVNTVGNLFSKSSIELILGSALTFVSSFLCLLIVRTTG